MSSGPRNRQRPWLRSGRDHDVFLASSSRLPNPDKGWGRRTRHAPLITFDIALDHRAGEVGRNVFDHVLFRGRSGGGPVEFRFADRDVMYRRRARFHAAHDRQQPALSLAYSRGSEQVPPSRSASIIATGHPGASDRTGHADAGIGRRRE